MELLEYLMPSHRFKCIPSWNYSLTANADASRFLMMSSLQTLQLSFQDVFVYGLR